MSKKLFVGNIEWGATEEDLTAAFAQYGTVEEAIIVKDKQTGRSKGFGFVTMSTEEEAKEAMENLEGFEINGRPIAVNEARPPKPREEE